MLDKRPCNYFYPAGLSVEMLRSFDIDSDMSEVPVDLTQKNIGTSTRSDAVQGGRGLDSTRSTLDFNNF